MKCSNIQVNINFSQSKLVSLLKSQQVSLWTLSWILGDLWCLGPLLKHSQWSFFLFAHLGLSIHRRQFCSFDDAIVSWVWPFLTFYEQKRLPWHWSSWSSAFLRHLWWICFGRWSVLGILVWVRGSIWHIFFWFLVQSERIRWKCAWRFVQPFVQS